MVLVDTSIWIHYFKGNESARPLDKLIDTNNLCINDLILAELLPSIVTKREFQLKELLCAITRIEIAVNWDRIIHMQIRNLKKGINNIGIPDLIIAQNAMDNGCELYTADRHFRLMSRVHGIKIHQG